MDEEILNKSKFNFNVFFQKNKSKIFSTIVLILIFFIILIFRNEYKKNLNIDISEKYNNAKILIENKNSQEALKILKNIILEKNKF